MREDYRNIRQGISNKINGQEGGEIEGEKDRDGDRIKPKYKRRLGCLKKK